MANLAVMICYVPLGMIGKQLVIEDHRPISIQFYGSKVFNTTKYKV